jgi:hypothetical protein
MSKTLTNILVSFCHKNSNKGKALTMGCYLAWQIKKIEKKGQKEPQEEIATKKRKKKGKEKEKGQRSTKIERPNKERRKKNKEKRKNENNCNNKLL